MNDFEESRLDEPLDDETEPCWLCYLCSGLAITLAVWLILTAVEYVG